MLDTSSEIVTNTLRLGHPIPTVRTVHASTDNSLAATERSEVSRLKHLSLHVTPDEKQPKSAALADSLVLICLFAACLFGIVAVGVMVADMYAELLRIRPLNFLRVIAGVH